MTLQMPFEWRTEGVGFGIPPEALSASKDMVLKIASAGSDRLAILRGFKRAFGDLSPSTSESWAESDLMDHMDSASENAAIFVESLYTGIQFAGEMGVGVPSLEYINRLLAKHDIPLAINPPDLTLSQGDVIVIGSRQKNDSNELHHLPFKRGELLGRGGFGEVYRVTRKTTVGEFEFAMKILEPSSFNDKPDRALARFTREIAVLKGLQHRGIVQYIEAGSTQEGKPYILMPLIVGDNLRDATEGKTLRFIVDLFAEIATALVYAHSQNVIHRDLKPTNILVRASDAQPIILDFGCAYLLDNTDSQNITTTLVGSVGYIPHEVLLKPDLRTPQHDVYACGVTLYEICGRCLPDPNDYRPLSDFRDELEIIDNLVRDAIAPATKRIKKMQEFLNRIQDIRARLIPLL